MLGVPRAYPNTSNKIVPLVYPLSTPVMGVDENFHFSPAGLRSVGIAPKVGGAIPCVYKCVGVVDAQDPTPVCERLHRHHLLPS